MGQINTTYLTVIFPTQWMFSGEVYLCWSPVDNDGIQFTLANTFTDIVCSLICPVMTHQDETLQFNIPSEMLIILAWIINYNC